MGEEQAFQAEGMTSARAQSNESTAFLDVACSLAVTGGEDTLVGKRVGIGKWEPARVSGLYSATNGNT